MSMLKLNVELHKLVMVMSVAVGKFQNIDAKNVTRYLKIIDVNEQQDVEN